MTLRITPILFTEIIIGAVTTVWIANFVAGLVVSGYDASPLNTVFMAIVGPGLTASAVSHFRSGKDEGGNKP